MLHSRFPLSLHAVPFYVACGVSLGAASAAAQSVTLAPSADATLFEANTDANGAGSYLIAGATTRFGLRRTLLRFDVAAAIPAGAIITSARLQLTMDRSIAPTLPFTLHALTAAWQEGTVDAGEPGGRGAPAQNGDATWLTRVYNDDPNLEVLWSTPAGGGDFQASPSAATAVAGPGTYTWGPTPALISDVQRWLDTPSTNLGWLLKAADEQQNPSAKRFASRESTDPAIRPQLVIDFVPQGTTCNDIDFNNDNSFFDPQDVEALLSVYGEAACVPSTATCDDIDFNNDTSLFDPCDIASFLTVYGEGPCTSCGQ